MDDEVKNSRKLTRKYLKCGCVRITEIVKGKEKHTMEYCDTCQKVRDHDDEMEWTARKNDIDYILSLPSSYEWHDLMEEKKLALVDDDDDIDDWLEDDSPWDE